MLQKTPASKDSKCGCPQGHVGSNPTASARKAPETVVFGAFFYPFARGTAGVLPGCFVARCRNLCPRSRLVSGPENAVCCLNCCPVVLKPGRNEWELIKSYGEFWPGFSETSAGNSTVSWYNFSTDSLRSRRTST